MDVKAVRIVREPNRKLVDSLARKPGRNVILRLQLTALVRIPVLWKLRQTRLLIRLRRNLLIVEELLLNLMNLLGRIDADALRVDLVQRRTILDDRVATRLSHGRIVHLAMPMLPVANQIDHDIGVEALPIFRRNRSTSDHGIRSF